MERLAGFIEGHYVYEIQVPTTIRDPQRVRITAYECRGVIPSRKKILANEVARTHVELEQMPYWDEPLQTIFLHKPDEARLKKSIEEFVDFLSN